MARLDETLARQVQRTGSNTGRLRSDAERAAFSTNVRADIATIMHQWNEVAVPLFEVLSSTDTTNAIELGLSGNSIFAHIQSTEASSPIFWDASLSRQRTVKESFDYTVSEFARLESLIAADVDVDAYDDTQVVADIAQLDLNLNQLRRDTMGLNYTFDNDGNTNLTYSISQAVDAIGAKFAGFPGTGNTYPDPYPALTLTVLLSEITVDTSVPQAAITNLVPHLQAIRDFIGKDTAGVETPQYSVHGPLTNVSDGQSLEEAIQVVDQAAAPSVWDLTSGVLSNTGPASTHTTDSFVVGSSSMDDTGLATEDIRMFLDKTKGAFRAGRAISTEWNDAERGNYSVALGDRNKALPDHSAALSGEANVITNAQADHSVIVGGRLNTIAGTGAQDHQFIGGGANNTTEVSYAVLVGGSTNTIYSNGRYGVVVGGLNHQLGLLGGDYGVIVGGSNHVMDADRSFIGGGNSQEISGSASESAIVCGLNNSVTSTFSFIGVGGDCIISMSGSSHFIGAGLDCAITGTGNFGAVLVGDTNIVQAGYSTILNGFFCTAESEYTTILGGRESRAIHTNEVVYGRNRDATSGIPHTQSSRVCWYGEEGNDTSFHALRVDGLSEQLVLEDNTSYHFTIHVAGRIQGSSTSAYYRADGIVHRGVGVATTTVPGVTVTPIHEDNANWDILVQEDTGVGALNLFVKADTGEFATWHAVGELIKIEDP